MIIDADDRDRDIVAARMANLDKNPRPRVGDVPGAGRAVHFKPLFRLYECHRKTPT